MEKITIYDVAKKAKVSISTASKALNDRKDVGDSTKERIRAIAADLNYEPSHFARALAMRKTGNIGVITVRYYQAPMLTNPFYFKIIEGIEEELINTDYNLVTNVIRKEQAEAMEIPKMVKEKSVDGIILLGYMPEKFVNLIVSKAPPTIIVDNVIKNPPVSTILMDNMDGATKAVEYLIDTGHKKIAYLSGPSSRYSFMQREQGYRKAHAARGIPVNEKFVLFNESEERGNEWMSKILATKDRPDAIFACNDVHAILAINMLKDHGLLVPDDISVLGFDNIEMSEHFIPSLSTVDINKPGMGTKAAQMLVDLINTKNNKVENIVFPTSIIIRKSVKNRD
ncbi:MAG: LacI family DNA-binding transcriptional regulator [bacterium]